jgi:hypothetical protein
MILVSFNNCEDDLIPEMNSLFEMIENENDNQIKIKIKMKMKMKIQ